MPEDALLLRLWLPKDVRKEGDSVDSQRAHEPICSHGRTGVEECRSAARSLFAHTRVRFTMITPLKHPLRLGFSRAIIFSLELSSFRQGELRLPAFAGFISSSLSHCSLHRHYRPWTVGFFGGFHKSGNQSSSCPTVPKLRSWNGAPPSGSGMSIASLHSACWRVFCVAVESVASLSLRAVVRRGWR